MTSLLLGLGAAGFWGVATLTLARGAQRIDGPVLAAGFLLGQGAIFLVPAALEIGSMSAGDLAVPLIAAAVEAVGVVLYMHALRIGAVSVIGPIVSLEGAFAASFGIAAGEPVSILAGVGLVLAGLGGLFMGYSRQVRLRGIASAYALVTAALFGLGLWLIAESPADTAMTMFLFNGVAGALVWMTVGRSLRASFVRTGSSSVVLVALAAFWSVAGYVCFLAGAAADSLAITAVFAAQFGVIAVVGGYLAFGERLGRVQLLGLILLVPAVSMVALSQG